MPGFETAAATRGEVVESLCDLTATAGALSEAAPAQSRAYDLRVGVSNAAGQVTEVHFIEAWQSLIHEPGGWRLASWWSRLDLIAGRDIPAGATPVDRYYQGQIRLAAYALSNIELKPGQPLEITSYWQALKPVEADYTVFNHLFGLDGTEVGRADEAPPVLTSRWLPGQVVSTTYTVETSPDLAAPAVATLDVGLYGKNDKALGVTDRQAQKLSVSLGRVKFVPAVWPDQPPPVAQTALFGAALRLEGHSILPAAIKAGSTDGLDISLWWQAVAPVGTDYAVLVHLVGAADNIVAQADGVPVGGRYPTSAWAPGEHIIDARRVVLPADIPPGTYRLLGGLYNPADGRRLSVDGTGEFRDHRRVGDRTMTMWETRAAWV